MNHRLNYGSDPEVFCAYEQNGIEFAYSPAALEKFDGVKRVGGDDKHPVFIDTEDYKVIMDGVAFEVNLKRPYSNLKEFYNTIQTAINHLEDFVGKHGYHVSRKPVIAFDAQRFWTPELAEDATFMQGVIFGCDPDSDAFNVEWLATILDTTTHPYRYGGGHIHLSGDSLIEQYPIPLIRLLAITVGNYCISKTPFIELEQERAQYYGKPGKFRIQNYSSGDVGVEYRTPSNAWTNYSFAPFEGIFAWVDKALDFLQNPQQGREIVEAFSDVTVEAITTANKQLATKILRELQ